METEQLNVEIKKAEILDAKKDALEVGTYFKDYVAEALRHFRKSLPIAERRRRFEAAEKRKLNGRPVSA